MHTSICASFALLLALSPDLSADVLIVDASGGGDFIYMHLASEAAADGDTLLVRPGDYNYVNVEGKSLNVVATPPGSATLLQARIEDLAPHQRVVLSGFVVVAQDHLQDEFYALHVLDCQGSVRVEDCSFVGEIGSYFTYGAAGQAAVAIEDSDDVALVRCELRGGAGTDPTSMCCTWDACPPDAPFVYSGGPGILMTESNAALYQCAIDAGTGSNAWCDLVAGPGGPGVRASGSHALLVDCVVRGGTGGFAEACACGGDGGAALDLEDSWIQLLDSAWTPGEPSPGSGVGTTGPELLQSGAVVVDVLPGAARELAAPIAVSAGDALQLTLRGEPGDVAFLAASWSPTRVPWPAASGLLLVAPPFVVGGLALGTVGAGGELVKVLPTPSQLGGADAVGVFLQALAVDAGGAFVLTGHRTVELVSAAIPL